MRHRSCVKKVLLSPALMLILNINMTWTDSRLHDLAERVITKFRSYQRDNVFIGRNEQGDTEINFSPTDMIKQDSYPAETHHVTTEDGYILTIHRIPGSTGSTPVYLQHGLLESSADWLIPGKNKSLAYILWDQGYDIWLGNSRGNTYSKNHTNLTTGDPEFWNFSFHEWGYYDLPAVTNYIADLTGERLFFIGHSMGGSTFCIMATERPEAAERIKAMIGLAPAVYVYHMKAPIKNLSPFWRQFQQTAKDLGVHEFFSRNKLFDSLAKYVCETILFRNILCSNPLFYLAGFDPEQLDYSLLPKIWGHFPAGTSVKVFTHWLQQMVVNKFRQFDYGPENNMKVYNSSEPPDYDLRKIQVPVTIFWGGNDILVGSEDTQTFYSQIPLKNGVYKVDNENFNHFDFLWAIDAPKILYPKVLNKMAAFNK